MNDTLTARQLLILAGHKLEQAGISPFTAEALTVQAWKDSPHKFGIKGFAEYPCTNSTYTYFMGERGLAKSGWMIKVGPKMYTLSRQGQQEARRLLEGDGSPLPRRRDLRKIRVPKDLERPLTELFLTTAFRRYEEGMKREITYRDACRFWSLSDTARGDQIDRTLAKVPALLAAVEQLLVGDACELSNGQRVTLRDLNALSGVHRFLTEQFARNLDRQRNGSIRPLPA